MENIFTADEINALSAEIDQQLIELQAGSTFKEGTLKAPTELDIFFEKQLKQIEASTKKPSKTFLKEFAKAAKAELCEDDGLLYKQWEKWSDLTNEDTLKVFGGVLAGMGISQNVALVVVVAVAVIVMRLGVRAFCETYSE